MELLDQATLIQNEVFEMRRDVIDFLYVTLFGIGRQALEWLVVLQSDVIPVLGLCATFARVYFDEVQEWLKTTGKELKTFGGPQGHRGLADPGGPRHQPDPAMAQRARLGAHQQPPLPLIQMREDRPELCRQHLPGFLHGAHTTPMSRVRGGYGLFFCNFLQ